MNDRIVLHGSQSMFIFVSIIMNAVGFLFALFCVLHNHHDILSWNEDTAFLMCISVLMHSSLFFGGAELNKTIVLSKNGYQIQYLFLKKTHPWSGVTCRMCHEGNDDALLFACGRLPKFPLFAASVYLILHPLSRFYVRFINYPDAQNEKETKEIEKGVNVAHELWAYSIRRKDLAAALISWGVELDALPETKKKK